MTSSSVVCLWQRFSRRQVFSSAFPPPTINFRRRAILQALMKSLMAIEVEVACQPACQRRHCGEAVQVQALVFHAPPQPLDEDVVQRSTATVHADRGAG